MHPTGMHSCCIRRSGIITLPCPSMAILYHAAFMAPSVPLFCTLNGIPFPCQLHTPSVAFLFCASSMVFLFHAPLQHSCSVPPPWHLCSAHSTAHPPCPISWHSALPSMPPVHHPQHPLHTILCTSCPPPCPTVPPCSSVLPLCTPGRILIG